MESKTEYNKIFKALITETSGEIKMVHFKFEDEETISIFYDHIRLMEKVIIIQVSKRYFIDMLDPIIIGVIN